jgi:hypothetical protein
VSGVDGYEPLPSNTEEENRDKDRTGEALRTLIPDWIRTGRMVKGQYLNPGQTKSIQHGLKRAPQGWLVMSLKFHTSGGSPPASGSMLIEMNRDASKLTLYHNSDGGGPYTFDLWVW